jgi:hypothetical protein
MDKNYFTRVKFFFGLLSLLFLNPTQLAAQIFAAKAAYLGQWAFAPGLAHKPTNSIYLMGTYQFGDIDQFTRYNVTTNTWSSIAGVPAIKSEFGFGFVVNNRIFFGGGVDQPGTFSNVVHEFTPPGSFSTVDNIPNGPASAFSFALGNFGYVGGGIITGFVNSNTMYRFDPNAPSGSQWTIVTNYPGSGKVNCGKASLNGFAYVGLGRSNPGSTEYNDFWRYDPNTGAGGTWTAISAFPGTPRECPIITPVCGKLILMGGVTQTGLNFNDIWQFDPTLGATGTWTFLGTNNGVYGPQNGRYGPAYAAYGDSLFLGMGFGASGVNNDWKMFTYCPPTPLPVELIQFDAKENNNHQVDISWSTASEINNDHFEIYRSTNANDWTMIDRVSGAGNSNTPIHYQIVDPLPENGINYYQLKQVDFNGDVSFFDVTSVNIQSTDALMVYPNPVGNELHILQKSLEPLSFDLVNSYGAIMISGTLTNQQTVIQLASLPAGIYYLRIEGMIRSNQKLVKL